MNRKAVGIFDSGLGGVSVLKECMALLPNENFIYFADSLNAPYGDKSSDEIISLLDKIMLRYFIPKGVKTVVLACNTATNWAVDYLRAKYEGIPIIGIEPAIKPAVENSIAKVLVLATEATIASDRFKKNIERFPEDKIISLGCKGLVELIELNDVNGIKKYFSKVVENINVSEVDSVVLGCTHYPFAKRYLKEYFGDDINFFDGSVGVANRLDSVLKELEIKNTSKGKGCLVVESSLGKIYNKKIDLYIRR